MSELLEWLHSRPNFTKYWLVLTVSLSLIGRFDFVSHNALILLYKEFIHKFEIWRAVTSVLYYPLYPGTAFHFLLNCYFLYNYGLRLERTEYDGRPADYLFMLLFSWMCCLVAGLICDFGLLMDPMILSVLYVWCQLNKDTIVHFWFGTQFKAIFLPWVLFLFDFIFSRNGMPELTGILVGHLYFFLKFKYPQDFGGVDLLSTPKFLENYFPPRSGGVRGFGATPTQQRPLARNAFGGHNWGQGRVLGQ